jgi:hypothetical protein
LWDARIYALPVGNPFARRPNFYRKVATIRRQFGNEKGGAKSAFEFSFPLHSQLGREPINLPGGWLARVRYAPIATKFRIATK